LPCANTIIALSRGAEILSESFIFFVSGAIVVYEYHRSSEKEKLKEEKRLQKIRDDASILQAKLVSLDKRLEALEEYAKANRKSILGIGAKYDEPENTVPIIDDSDSQSEKMVHADQETTPNSNSSSTTNNNDAKPARARRWFWPFG
jgi:hypothetical protein